MSSAAVSCKTHIQLKHVNEANAIYVEVNLAM